MSTAAVRNWFYSNGEAKGQHINHFCVSNRMQNKHESCLSEGFSSIPSHSVSKHYAAVGVYISQHFFHCHMQWKVWTFT